MLNKTFSIPINTSITDLLSGFLISLKLSSNVNCLGLSFLEITSLIIINSLTGIKCLSNPELEVLISYSFSQCGLYFKRYNVLFRS